jgi:hypothetical protein
VNNPLSFTAVLAVMTFVNMSSCFAAEPQWGTFKGQFVFDGVVPKLPPLVRAVPGLVNQDVPDETLVVDRTTKGIANIIIYLPSRPVSVHPDLEKNGNVDGNEKTDDEVVFDRKDGRFVPHATIVRTSQKIRLLNDDAVAHNFVTFPIRNAIKNILVKPNDREGIVLQPMTISERTPTMVKSGIHVWMSAYMLVVDHPYAAVTGKDGRFEIRNLPVGTHEFRVWHEARGYLEKKIRNHDQRGCEYSRTNENHTGKDTKVIDFY